MITVLKADIDRYSALSLGLHRLQQSLIKGELPYFLNDPDTKDAIQKIEDIEHLLINVRDALREMVKNMEQNK